MSKAKKKLTTRQMAAMFKSKKTKELEKRVLELEEQNEVLTQKYEDLESELTDARAAVAKIIELHEGEWE